MPRRWFSYARLNTAASALGSADARALCVVGVELEHGRWAGTGQGMQVL